MALHGHSDSASRGDGLILALGICACSTSVLFIKGSHLHPITLALLRLLIACTVLLPLFLRDLRRHASALGRGELLRGLWPGAVLGLHLIVWNAGARMTSAVNASLVVNMVPLATPGMLWLSLRERLTRAEWRGTALGVAGVVVLAGRDYSLERAHFEGDTVCLVAMLLFAAYLVLARRNRGLPSVFLYVVPLYATAAATCAVASVFVRDPLHGLGSAWEWAMALGLGLLPTVLGHSALNYAMTRFRGQLVTLANLGQPLSAGVLAFVLLGEVPRVSLYLAAVLVLSGVVTALGGSRALLART